VDNVGYVFAIDVAFTHALDRLVGDVRLGLDLFLGNDPSALLSRYPLLDVSEEQLPYDPAYQHRDDQHAGQLDPDHPRLRRKIAQQVHAYHPAYPAGG
jgi:hypothetical protein